MSIMHEPLTASLTAYLAAEDARREREASEQQDHAMTLLRELVAQMPVRPSAMNINRHSEGFQLRYGVELVMPQSVADLTGVQRALGGQLLVESLTSVQGTPYTKVKVLGQRAGVPFLVWTTVYPARPQAVAA
jgi:hypothetical protein